MHASCKGQKLSQVKVRARSKQSCSRRPERKAVVGRRIQKEEGGESLLSSNKTENQIQNQSISTGDFQGNSLDPDDAPLQSSPQNNKKSILLTAKRLLAVKNLSGIDLVSKQHKLNNTTAFYKYYWRASFSFWKTRGLTFNYDESCCKKFISWCLLQQAAASAAAEDSSRVLKTSWKKLCSLKSHMYTTHTLSPSPPLVYTHMQLSRLVAWIRITERGESVDLLNLTSVQFMKMIVK